MAFISYAQNFEDVILWRALKHVNKGFYIDVGAWSPDIDSVTRAFYERGWRGINIEPNNMFYHQLKDRREYDINLQIAVGHSEGMAEMSFVGDTGLSSLDNQMAQGYTHEGHLVTLIKVVVRRLDKISAEYVPDMQEVHFMKVDVEGLEADVLRSNDWKVLRPWIVVVEAMLPMRQVESHSSWEQILLDADYKLCYKDGLNRFYLAKEHADLELFFEYPPNVFDDFVKSYVHDETVFKKLELSNFLKRLRNTAKAAIQSILN